MYLSQFQNVFAQRTVQHSDASSWCLQEVWPIYSVGAAHFSQFTDRLSSCEHSTHWAALPTIRVNLHELHAIYAIHIEHHHFMYNSTNTTPDKYNTREREWMRCVISYIEFVMFSLVYVYFYVYICICVFVCLYICICELVHQVRCERMDARRSSVI